MFVRRSADTYCRCGTYPHVIAATLAAAKAHGGLSMAKQATFRTEKFPCGIASVGLGTVERQIPADEPPPLPPNSELAVIGKSFPRPNGRAKVTGAIRFTVDIALPGMLHARVLRSPLPHAGSRPSMSRRPRASSWRPRGSADRRSGRSDQRKRCAISARPSRPSPPFPWPAAEAGAAPYSRRL